MASVDSIQFTTCCKEEGVEVITKELRRCDLIRAKGRIDSSTVDKLAEAFDSVKEMGRYRIVLNMHDVTYISSAGLSELIDAQNTCKRWNRGELVLAEVPARIKEVLDMAGLTPLFAIYDSETEAVGSF